MTFVASIELGRTESRGSHVGALATEVPGGAGANGGDHPIDITSHSPDTGGALVDGSQS